jgi:hypothetical protein
MHSRLAAATMARAALLPALLALGACSHLHWPWHHTPPAPPAPVHALDISSGAATEAFAQYWKRNTLLVDLSGASGSGHITLRPAGGESWPVRLAFRVTPGAFGALEVRGDARAVLPINSSGTRAVDLELTPGIYTAGTRAITVSWGPQPELAP